MILYLRNATNNKTVVEVEIYTEHNLEIGHHTELSSFVCIDTYSVFLLENLDLSHEIMRDFEAIQELRGWLWEDHFRSRGSNDGTKTAEVVAIVSARLRAYGTKYGLNFVTD